MRYAKWMISFLFLMSVLGSAAGTSPNTVVRVKLQMANVRESPDIKSTIIMTVKMGTVFEVVNKTGPWYAVVIPKAGTQSSGYIHESVVEEIAPSADAKQVPPPAEEKKKPAENKVIPSATQTEPKGPAPNRSSEKPFRKIFARLQYQMGFQKEGQSLSLSRTVYYEDAQYGLNYSAKKGNSIDAAFGYRFTRMMGVALGFSSTSRGMAESTSASIPHPLWTGSPRTGEAEAASLKIDAIDLYLNLVFFLEVWKFGIDIYAGPCYMLTKASVITDIVFNEGSYPYSQVTIAAPTASVKSNVIGFDAGAALGFNLGGNLAVFVDGRYVTGKGSYKSGTDIGNLPISLGGFKAGAGIKFMF